MNDLDRGSVENCAITASPMANTKIMSMHLAEISRVIAPNAHAALVLDGAGYHVAADLVVPDNITLVPRAVQRSLLSL